VKSKLKVIKIDQLHPSFDVSIAKSFSVLRTSIKMIMGSKRRILSFFLVILNNHKKELYEIKRGRYNHLHK